MTEQERIEKFKLGLAALQTETGVMPFVDFQGFDIEKALTAFGGQLAAIDAMKATKDVLLLGCAQIQIGYGIVQDWQPVPTDGDENDD